MRGGGGGGGCEGGGGEGSVVAHRDVEREEVAAGGALHGAVRVDLEEEVDHLDGGLGAEGWGRLGGCWEWWGAAGGAGEAGRRPAHPAADGVVDGELPLLVNDPRSLWEGVDDGLNRADGRLRAGAAGRQGRRGAGAEGAGTPRLPSACGRVVAAQRRSQERLSTSISATSQRGSLQCPPRQPQAAGTALSSRIHASLLAARRRLGAAAAGATDKGSVEAPTGNRPPATRRSTARAVRRMR